MSAEHIHRVLAARRPGRHCPCPAYSAGHAVATGTQSRAAGLSTVGEDPPHECRWSIDIAGTCGVTSPA